MKSLGFSDFPPTRADLAKASDRKLGLQWVRSIRMRSLHALVHSRLEMGAFEQSREEGKEELGSRPRPRLGPVNTWGTRENSKREASHGSDA